VLAVLAVLVSVFETVATASLSARLEGMVLIGRGEAGGESPAVLEAKVVKGAAALTGLFAVGVVVVVAAAVATGFEFHEGVAVVVVVAVVVMGAGEVVAEVEADLPRGDGAAELA